MPLFEQHVTQAFERINVVGISGYEFFQYLAGNIEITGSAIGIAPQVIDIFNLRIELGSTIKVSSSGSPFAFSVIGVCARINVGCLIGFQLYRARVFRNSPIPVTCAGVFASKQEMKIRIVRFTLKRVSKLYDGIPMIVLSAGNQCEAKMRLGRIGIQIRSLSQVSRSLIVTIEIV